MNQQNQHEEISDLTNEQIEVIRDFGALGYSVKKMQTILNHPDKDYVKLQMMDVDSVFYKEYQIGKDTYEFDIHCKLIEMAKSGDLLAMEKIEGIKESEKYSKFSI